MNRGLIFNSVRIRNPRHNVFDLSHENKLSLNMTELVPIYVQDIIPGDRFKVRTEMLMRFAPMIAPIMHRIDARVEFFFVPNRLVWEDWEKFITGGEDGSEMPPFPMVLAGQARQFLKESSLADYMGIPPCDPDQLGGGLSFSLLPFRAYQLIWNEWYRDQNLQEPIDVPLGSLDTSALADMLTIRRRCWEKDYFTSALPWTQRGGDVTLPLSGRAEVILDHSDTQGMPYLVDGQNKLPTAGELYTDSAGTIRSGGSSGSSGLYINPNESLWANLSEATASTVNELRRANQLQKWLEVNARAGSRYIEQIYAHFGVRSSDARLQRPEYLGGFKQPVSISEVLQTSQSTSEPLGGEYSPQGNMAGHGISVGGNTGFVREFEEHGYIIGILSVMPRTSYQQGIPRHFMKSDKFDFAFPEFAHLGEQPILNAEIYADYDAAIGSTVNQGTFGYQSRYAEYKYMPSEVHGEFRTSLDFWHLGRIFLRAPGLNSEFVEARVDNRIFAVQDENASAKLYAQLWFDVKAMRKLPVFGTPSF